MRQKQINPLPSVSRYRIYSPTAMFNAFQAVRERNMPVKQAARQYGVPQTTLRDRVAGRVDPETMSSGPQALFSQEEEALFVNHLKAMAELGYGYSRVEVVDQASNYAVSLGKRDMDHPLSDRWFRGFLCRWPEMKVLKPRALSKYRAQATSSKNITQYFANLKTALQTGDLMQKPECIYNVDEKGIQTEHNPPYIVCANKSVPAITSDRSCTTTIIGCGNAIGTQIPPFFVFKGQRMRSELLDGASTGAQGTVSDSGWSNSSVFLEYLDSHFIKYIQRENERQPVILIFDGHKSHVTLPVLDWAREHNICLFVLPAHTSHVLQPLDVGCFGPLQRIYNSECHKFLRANPSSKITRYNVCSLACTAYTAALSSSNLRSSFKRTGIYPYKPEQILDSQLAPSKAYISPESPSETENETSCEALDKCQHRASGVDKENYFITVEKVIRDKQTFEQKTQKNNISKIVSGTLITSSEKEKEIREHFGQSMKKASETKGKSAKKRNGSTNTSKVSSKKQHMDSEQPGISGVTVASVLSSDSSDEEINEEEKCCVCKRWEPEELKNCVSLVITKWAKCDYPSCNHWTHLKFCCNQTVVRRHSEFVCPCHVDSEKSMCTEE